MKKVLLVLMALSLGVSASAATITFDEAVPVNVYSNNADFSMSIVDDGSGTNNVLRADTLSGWSSRAGSMALPAIVPEAGTYMVEMDIRYTDNGGSSNWQLGLADYAVADRPGTEASGNYDDFGPLVNFEQAGDGVLTVRSGYGNTGAVATGLYDTAFHLGFLIHPNTEAYNLYVDGALLGYFTYRTDGNPPPLTKGALETLLIRVKRSDIQIDNVAVNATTIPEPATMVLLGLGSLMAIRRKK